MKSFRLSPVGLGVVAALALGQTGYVGAEETATQSSEAKEVITIVGSQVDLGGDYQGGQVARSGRAGILGNQDFMDTPFSSSNYTSKLIEDQQAKSVGDVLKNDPTVRQAVGYGNFQDLTNQRVTV